MPQRAKAARGLGPLLTALALSATTVAAQDQGASPEVAAGGTGEPAEALVTDRPDFTESVVSVAPRRVQVEAGYTHEEKDGEASDAFGELLLRIGLSERVELRLAPNSYRRDLPRGGDDAEGREDPSIGIKLETGHGGDAPSLWKPATALLLGTTLPLGDSEVTSDELLPSAILALEWELGGGAGIGSNIGAAAEADERGRFVTGVFSVALGFDLGGAWGGFVEYYTFVPEGSERQTQQFFDAGLTFQISDDFQLDARIGTEAGGETDWFAGVGLAYRW